MTLTFGFIFSLIVHGIWFYFNEKKVYQAELAATAYLIWAIVTVPLTAILFSAVVIFLLNKFKNKTQTNQ